MAHRVAAGTVFVALMLAGTVAQASTPNAIYVVAKRVDMFPDEANATEVVIYGNATFYESADAGTQYGPVSCGYLHFKCKTGEEATCRMQWSELKTSVASPTCLGMGQQSVVSTATLHTMGTPLGTPDVYDIGTGLPQATSLGGKCDLLKTNVCNVTVSSDAGVDAKADVASDAAATDSTSDVSVADTKSADTSTSADTSAADTKTSAPDTSTSAADTSTSAADTSTPAADTGAAPMDRCSEDGSAAISRDGRQTICTPYLCTQGACMTKCSKDDDCSPGIPCDPASRACAKPAPVVDDGCSFGAPGTAWGGGAFALALAACARLARRRRAT